MTHRESDILIGAILVGFGAILLAWWELPIAPFCGFVLVCGGAWMVLFGGVNDRPSDTGECFCEDCRMVLGDYDDPPGV